MPSDFIRAIIVCGSNQRAGLALVAAFVVMAGGVGCSRSTQPAGPDLTLAFAARSALVNDAVVGAAAVDIEASAGVVTLRGLVASADERQRAVALVRAVPGVARVDDELVVSTTAADSPPASDAAREDIRPAKPPSNRSALPSEDASPPGRHLAVGGTLTVPTQTINALSGHLAFGPAFRLGRGGGWHPAFSWTRVRSDLPEPSPGADPFGQLRISAVAGGIGHEFTHERWSIDPAVMLGYGFNHVRLDPGFTVPRDVRLLVAASGAPVALGGATLWIETTSRVSIGLSSGYLFCRPDTTWLDGERFIRRRLKADVWLASVSVAYWVF